jgi:hypothetical protein
LWRARTTAEIWAQIQSSLGSLFLKPPRLLGLAYCDGPTRFARRESEKNALANAELLKEKPRRRFQLLGGFKQDPAAHTLLALLVSLNFQ